LGYLGELETRLTGTLPPPSSSPSTSSSSAITLDSSISNTSPSLRSRFKTPHLLDQSLLQQLSTLKEDISSYLPHLPYTPPHFPRAPTISREWLSALPGRLLALELSHPGLPLSQLEESRKRVLEVVHALLPSEDWGGWETLGWEDEGSTLRGRVPRRVGDSRVFGEDEGEEEPEYLFPNRTPASLNAIATRRRAVRSKSLGSSLDNRYTLPTLARTRTAPLLTHPSYAAEKDEEKEQGEDDEEDVLDILDSPELMDTKLTKILASGTGGGALGPSLAEALERSDRGGVLITYEDLPFGWRNNEHVLTG
jgi:adiponectin receptor